MRARIAGSLFLVLGAGLLAVAVWGYVSTRRFVAGAARTTGTVIKLAERRETDRGRTRTSYAPVVRFVTARGVHGEFPSRLGSNPPAYRVGDRVPVLYNPADPREAAIATFLSLWLFTLLFGFVGTVFAGIGAVMLALGRRRPAG